MDSLNRGNACWIEPGSFEQPGGWVLDTQFIEAMGGAYLLAHGLGQPVESAQTTISLPGTGEWQLWVYTRDWVAPWKQGCAPGLFSVEVDDQISPVIFGDQNGEWNWQRGDAVLANRSVVKVALHDLTGFEGRCAGILLVRDKSFIPPSGRDALIALRKHFCRIQSSDTEHYDLFIAGGGITGMACAVYAARRGLRTVLVQDRPVLGGNNSSEVRVWLSGKTRFAPFPKLGCVTDEFNQAISDIFGTGNRAQNYEDTRKREILMAEPCLTVLTDFSVVGSDVTGSRINAVHIYDVHTGGVKRLTADLFADCTGDAVLGASAGAHYEMTTSGHMEMSNFWNIIETDTPQPFPKCTWALDIGDASVPGRLRAGGSNPKEEKESTNKLGCWYWGSGYEHNPITHAEYARDTNFRAMYGVWDALKNRDGDFINYRLEFAAYIAGKRESRRLLGDIILTKEDFLSNQRYEDALIGVDWKLDLHRPKRMYYSAFTEGDAFLADDCYESFDPPYYIPYRCLYSRNIENLFMAGRCISTTHDALGPVRVMRTCGMMGEAVGEAAVLCAKHDVLPRSIYSSYINELMEAFR